MSDEQLTPAKINLLDEFPKEITAILSNDYRAIEHVFHLAGVAIENIHNDLSNNSKKKMIDAPVKALLARQKKAAFSELIQEELNYLRIQLQDIGKGSYVDSFKTERRLFELAQERYNLSTLSPKQQGTLILIFYILGFEFYQLVDCEIFWKLTDSKVPDLAKITDVFTKILDEKLHALDFDTLKYAVDGKMRGKFVDAALLRFLLGVNHRIEYLDGKDSYQIKFSELNVHHYPYRILYEKGEEMDVAAIYDKIITLLRGTGKKPPVVGSVKSSISNNALYKPGSVQGKFALADWNVKREKWEDILQAWFIETKTPATADEMVAHIQTIRPDLNISTLKGQISKHIKLIEVTSESTKNSKPSYHYHSEAIWPEGWEKVPKKKAPAKNNSKQSAKRNKAPVVFISYAHEDEKWRDLFKKYLQDSERDGILTVWDDTQIPVGEKWDKEIEDALDETDIALLLVTQDFVNSTFIYEQELPYLIEQEKIIHWVYVDYCTKIPDRLQSIQSAYFKDEPLVKRKKEEEEIAKICRKIVDAAQEFKKK